jgi:DNA-binding SARP family transcriptional activator
VEATVRLLGAPSVRTGRAWTDLRPRKPHALLAYVASRGGPVRRAELAALLWPEGAAAQANASLRQALRSLASGPFGTMLERDHETATVHGESDLAGFRAACAEGRWGDAFALYRGPFLDGLELDGAPEFASWLHSERSTLEETWRGACGALLREAEADGRWPDALRYADLLIRADPLDESATRDAMRLAAVAGDVHGAVRRYRTLAALLDDELGLEPESATTALLATLRAAPPPAGPRPPASPPAAATGTAAAASPERGGAGAGAAARHALLPPRVAGRQGVIGRDADVAALGAVVLRDDTRLVTLLGPGGVGKSTLVGALAIDLARAFPDGVIVVPLEGRAGSDAVALAVADVAGVTVRAGAAPARQVAVALGRRRSLLVLDGFEPHLSEVATVDALVRAAVELRIVVTSRARLGLSSETVYDVSPLATRPTDPTPAVLPEADHGPSDAARLFVRNAARVVGPTGVAVHDRDAVERIVAALGGHPLAIELAAAWLPVLGLAGLETHLRTSWEPLSSDDVDRSERRRDVHGAIDESWRQLAEADRAAWARLAVMPGSIDPSVAATVAGSGWRGLRRLVDRAIVRRDGGRLEMHALVRRFGRERAEDAGLADAAWEAALPIWRQRFASDVDPTTGRRMAVHPFDLEQGLGAWHWAVRNGRWSALADMVPALPRALDRSMRRDEYRASIEGAVAALQPARGAARDVALARVRALVGRDREGAESNARAALAMAERCGDDVARALALRRLAMFEPTREDEALLGEARAALERVGDRVGLASLLTHVAVEQRILVGRYAEGSRLLDEVEVLLRELGDPHAEVDVHDARTTEGLLTGDVASVRAHLVRARSAYAESGEVLLDAGLYTTEAWLGLVEGDAERAHACIETFTERMGRITDVTIPRTVLRMGYHSTFGPAEEAVACGRALLEIFGDERPSVVGALTQLTIARACSALGDDDAARSAVLATREMLRAVDWPRFVPHLAYAVATLAAAAGDHAAATALLAGARGHPSLEGVVATDVDALYEQLTGTACPRSEGLDDAALLALVDRALASA